MKFPTNLSSGDISYEISYAITHKISYEIIPYMLWVMFRKIFT